MKRLIVPLLILSILALLFAGAWLLPSIPGSHGMPPCHHCYAETLQPSATQLPYPVPTGNPYP